MLCKPADTARQNPKPEPTTRPNREDFIIDGSSIRSSKNRIKLALHDLTNTKRNTQMNIKPLANLAFALIMALSATDISSGQSNQTGGLVYGKYGCTASHYSGGFYEYMPRGFFTVARGGKY